MAIKCADASEAQGFKIAFEAAKLANASSTAAEAQAFKTAFGAFKTNEAPHQSAGEATSMGAISGESQRSRPESPESPRRGHLRRLSVTPLPESQSKSQSSLASLSVASSGGSFIDLERGDSSMISEPETLHHVPSIFTRNSLPDAPGRRSLVVAGIDDTRIATKRDPRRLRGSTMIGTI